MRSILARAAAVAITLCLIACPALAAGKLVVEQENFHVTVSYSLYGYAFARVENTGNKPAEFSAGLLEIYDAEGDTLTSTDSVYCYPRYLEPGETGYVYAYDSIDTTEALEDVDDYLLTVTGKSTESKVVLYPVTAYYQTNVQVTKYSSYNYVVAEVTNNTDETVFGLEMVVVLLDDSDNILYMGRNSYYSSTGINAGSTITYRESISNDWFDAWTREGLTPTHAVAIAYKEVQDW